MPALTPTLRRALAAASTAAILAGCASSAPRQTEEPAPQTSILSTMLTRPLVVFPAQFISLRTASGAVEVSPANQGLLAALDAEIAAAFRSRGVRDNWTFAEELTAAARRNGGLAGDPNALPAAALRRVRAGDTPLPEGLGSPIRSLVGLTSARYALIPVELTLAARGPEASNGLRLVLVDARTARVVWADAVTIPATHASIEAALAPDAVRQASAALAARLADLVVAQ